MMHTNLVAYYERLFAFKTYHQWNISEIEDLIPWEIDVMTTFINNLMEQRELMRKQAQNRS